VIPRLGEAWANEARLDEVLEGKDHRVLIHLYAILEKAYINRRAYRTRFFDRQYWDRAHDEFMKYIIRAMLRCEQRVEECLKNKIEKDRLEMSEEYEVSLDDADEMWYDLSQPIPKITRHIQKRNRQILDEEFWRTDIEDLYRAYREQVQRFRVMADRLFARFPQLGDNRNRDHIFCIMYKYLSFHQQVMDDGIDLARPIMQSRAPLQVCYRCPREAPLDDLYKYVCMGDRKEYVNRVETILQGDHLIAELLHVCTCYVNHYDETLNISRYMARRLGDTSRCYVCAMIVAPGVKFTNGGMCVQISINIEAILNSDKFRDICGEMNQRILPMIYKNTNIHTWLYMPELDTMFVLNENDKVYINMELGIKAPSCTEYATQWWLDAKIDTS
jgi:hypothetical protein